ncbi:MAG: hypothetical protein HQK89_15795 [Nitrospirae bacterium]|nr:hypothetical protein [Nitrospirota bacterium]
MFRNRKLMATVGMITINVALVLTCAATLMAGTVNLPQTGQAICRDTSGNVIPCTGTGQDRDIQAGAAWQSPRFTDNGDSTMTDALTA